MPFFISRRGLTKEGRSAILFNEEEAAQIPASCRITILADSSRRAEGGKDDCAEGDVSREGRPVLILEL